MFISIEQIENKYNFNFTEPDLILKNEIFTIFNCQSYNELINCMFNHFNSELNKNILNNIYGLYFMYVTKDYDKALNCFQHCDNEKYYPVNKNLGELHFTLFKEYKEHKNFNTAKQLFIKCIDNDIEVIKRLIALEGFIYNYNGVKKYSDLYREKYNEKLKVNVKELIKQHFC